MRSTSRELRGKVFSNRRLLSRYRYGCHGLGVDTERQEVSVHLMARTGFQILSSLQVNTRCGGEYHLLFGCPVYSSLRASLSSLFQQTYSVSDFLLKCEANA